MDKWTWHDDSDFNMATYILRPPVWNLSASASQICLAFHKPSQISIYQIIQYIHIRSNKDLKGDMSHSQCLGGAWHGAPGAGDLAPLLGLGPRPLETNRFPLS